MADRESETYRRTQKGNQSDSEGLTASERLAQFDRLTLGRQADEAGQKCTNGLRNRRTDRLTKIRDRRDRQINKERKREG